MLHYATVQCYSAMLQGYTIVWVQRCSLGEVILKVGLMEPVASQDVEPLLTAQ